MTYKKILIALLVLAALGVGWYLLSPIFRVEERDEPFPRGAPIINDALDTMDQKTRAEFEAAVEATKEKEMAMIEAMPAAPQILAQGEFLARSHEVEGRALLILHDGKKALRFEDFNTINGPDLHIYLSSDLGGDDYVALGKIRATRGNVNYEVDASIDTQKYNKVLVWCVPLGAFQLRRAPVAFLG